MSAVVFDLDGTLVDSAPDVQAALNRVLEMRGHPPFSLERVRGFIGNGVTLLLHRSMEAVGAPEAEFEGWRDDYLGQYGDAVCDLTRPYPGMVEALDRLVRDGYRLGICTNKPQQLTDDLLAALGLADRFGAVLGGDAGFGLKPAPQGLAEVVRRLGEGPAVMVGDSLADAGAARAAGLPLILHAGGYRDREVAEMGPDAAFEDWATLPGLVRDLLG